MSRHTNHHTLTTIYQALRRQRQPADELGFGYSRTDTPPEPVLVPDGVDLHFFTGRTRQEATR